MTHDEDTREEALRLSSELEAEISAANATLLRDLPVRRCLDLVESEVVVGQPWHISRDAHAQAESVAARTSEAIAESYHKLLLTELILRFPERSANRPLPESVEELFRRTFARILRDMGRKRRGFYRFENGLFRLDLGLCRMRFIPCGLEVVDELGTLPRRTLWSGGLAQLAETAGIVMSRTRGFAPFLATHMDRRQLRHFGEPAFIGCYLKVAELLELRPGVRGVISSSWWHDPRLGSINPELDFLREIPCDNGAFNLKLGTDVDSVTDALAFSTKRRTLYEEGKYVPTRYIIVWPRLELLDWAHRVRPDHETLQRIGARPESRATAVDPTMSSTPAARPSKCR